MRKITALFMSMLCVCLLLLGIPAYASSGQNRLTLHYYATNEAIPLAGAEFYLYRVGVPDSTGEYRLTDDFKDYQVDISELDFNEAGRLTMLAITLSGYAERDGIVPLKTGCTDARGDLTFEDLEDGLYLVWGDVLNVDVGDTEWNFTPQPMLIPLPYPDGDPGIRDMEVDVKYDRFPPPTQDELVDLTVIKKWKGGEEHPDSVIVQLMRNGVITDTAELNPGNNWQYTWKNLNSGYVWKLMEEEVPEGYTVTVHQEGYVFTITNKNRITESGNAERTTAVSNPSAHETTYTTAENTTKAQDMATSDTPSDTVKLPQTGQLWWPVPILAGAGLILFGAGLLLRRDEDA